MQKKITCIIPKNLTFDLQWYNCKIWYRLISGSAAKLLKWSWKKRHHTYWWVYTQHGDLCIDLHIYLFFDRRRARRHPCLLLSVSRAVPANLSGGSRTKGKTSLYGLYSSWNSWKKENNCALFLYCLQLMDDYKQSTQYYHDNQVFYKVIASLLSWFVMEIKVYICTCVTIFKWRFEGHIHIVLTCRVSCDTPDDYNV